MIPIRPSPADARRIHVQCLCAYSGGVENDTDGLDMREREAMRLRAGGWGIPGGAGRGGVCTVL